MSSFLGFCLWWCSNFVGSESGQKQSVKLLQNGLQHNSAPPPPHSHTALYTVRLLWEGGVVGEVREKVEGKQFTRGVENTNVTSCISSRKHQ
jgi:hypothetical protein